ncbi:MCE family protein [Streptomyces meridianus]|uniref:MCE family protein n=1 Tax=Streptomyces meridianus TaxID=2938945 RepID=A0ABT0X981_9ACTN|nr:MCE family protein [Streptomyces meridianus]MCM2578329.1 MCE family protein [Streptomyces meridianus]
MNRRPARRLALLPALLLVAGVAFHFWSKPSDVQITAYFPRTVGIHPGSDVRVLGVRIGEVTAVQPQGDRVRVGLRYDAEQRVPAAAKAAVINSSVVSDRYVQLLPAYRTGPVMRSGTVIPQSRTAVPVELDRVFDSLHTTAKALGPKGANQDGSLSRLLGVSADNLGGQGEQLNGTVKDLSKAVTTLSNGREDMFGTVRNLQVFTGVLAADDGRVRSFNDNLAKVAGQLAGERKDLAKAIKELARALGEVALFVKDNRKALSQDVKGLSEVTKVLVEQRAALEELADVFPAGLSNLDLAYNPATGALDTRNNAQKPQDPAAVLCSLLRTTGDRTDCGDLRKLFDKLPELPTGEALSGLPLKDGKLLPISGTGTVDRSFGGILEVRT